jgi:general secretion pathway protein N
VAAALSQASEGRVQLLEPRGTLWNGSALLRLTGGAGSRDAMALPSRLAWTLRPAIGATTSSGPGLTLQLQADCCTRAPLALALGWHPGGMELALTDTPASQWPAGLLAGLGTPWNTLDLEGRLQLQTQGLALRWEAGRLQMRGRAELSLMEASSRLATLRPLGSYRLRLEGGAIPGLELDTLDGALQLQGRGQWVGERLRFSGEASAQAGREAALDNLLNIIGRRTGARSLITLG